MAEATLIWAMKKVALVAAKKGLELYEIYDQIAPMQNNLELIQGFLRDADKNQHKTESGKVWVNQVRELAYRIDLAMDTFLVEIEKNSPEKSFLSKLKRVGKHPLKLNKLSSELKLIRKEMKKIIEIRPQQGSCSEEPVQLPSNIRPTKPSHVIDSEVVGFDSDKHKIISHLLDKSILRRTVLSIVGEGGLGKTTLAQKVYNSAELNAEFTCRTWLSISQKFDEKNIFRQILKSVEPTINPADEDLWEELNKSLSGKRYLIILDDVWTIDLWEQLKVVLPDAKNASRVIITTRDLDVALKADRNTEPHKLGYLNEDDSLALLFRKALQQDKQSDKYPPHLVKVAKKLMGKCGGLPLALVVLGGMLSTKSDSCTAWTRVYNTFDWHSDQGKQCSQILRMSYQDLCYEQKQCFQYFAAFPEDYEIEAQHITRMWIAEGLIPVDGRGTLEDRAENYFENLVKRSLVQVVRNSWNDNCKYCWVHDLLRDLAIHEAKQQNFITVLSKNEDGSQLAYKETHRVALQFDTPTGYDIHSTKIRSLLCFGGSLSNYQKFTQLRVLVFEGIDFREIIVGKNWLKRLVHMKYLAFRSCHKMKGIIESISFKSMKNLETFWWDYEHIYGSDTHRCYELMWEAPTLRHIIIKSNPTILCPMKWDNLKNLQTLKWVTLEGIPKLDSNVNLRTLKILLSEQEESWKGLEALLSRTKYLIDLAIRCENQTIFQPVNIRELPCYETIHCLNLSGIWAEACVPALEMFPENLTKLKLYGSGFRKDPMPILESLQCLRILLLDAAYLGEKLICSTGGFPSLQKLELVLLPNLSEWEIKESAMPVLSQLKIDSCHSLSRLPELQNVQSLQELIVSEYLPELKTRLQSEDLYKIKHIPSVQISNPSDSDSDSDSDGDYYYDDDEDEDEKDDKEDDNEDDKDDDDDEDKDDKGNNDNDFI